MMPSLLASTWKEDSRSQPCAEEGLMVPKEAVQFQWELRVQVWR